MQVVAAFLAPAFGACAVAGNDKSRKAPLFARLWAALMKRSSCATCIRSVHHTARDWGYGSNPCKKSLSYRFSSELHPCSADRHVAPLAQLHLEADLEL
jgi:hypothetical protein